MDQQRAEAEVAVDALIAPWLAGPLRAHFGNRLHVGEPDDDGRLHVRINCWDPSQAARELAGYEDLIVLDPPAARAALAAAGARLTARYAGG